MDSIYTILKPLRLRVIAERTFNSFIFSLSAAFIISGVLFAVGKFVYIEEIVLIALYINLTVIIITLCASLLRIPDYYRTAQICDSLGFKERFVTSLELHDKNDYFAKLVINDAVNAVSGMNLTKIYGFNINLKGMKLLALSFIVMLVCGFSPSPMAGRLEEMRKFNEEKALRIEIANQMAQELLAEASPKQAEEIKKLAKELEKDINASKTQAETIKAVKKAQEKILDFSKTNLDKDMRTLGESLKNHEMTKGLGEALENEDYESINEQFEELTKMLDSMSEEEIKELADILSEAAEEIEGNESLKNDLNNLSQALESGNLSEISESVATLNQALNSLASQNANLKKALEKYNKAISGSNKNQSSEGQQSGQGEQNHGEGQGQSQGQGQGQGQSQGQGQGQGQGQSQGQGQGQGQSQGQGQGAGGNNPGGSGQGSGHVENSEKYSREAIYKKDTEFSITGSQSEGGQMIEQEIKRIGEGGEVIPYDSVYTEYRDRALNTLDDSPIPYGLKEIVRDYFTSLE